MVTHKSLCATCTKHPTPYTDLFPGLPSGSSLVSTPDFLIHSFSSIHQLSLALTCQWTRLVWPSLQRRSKLGQDPPNLSAQPRDFPMSPTSYPAFVLRLIYSHTPGLEWEAHPEYQPSLVCPPDLIPPKTFLICRPNPLPHFSTSSKCFIHNKPRIRGSLHA